MATRPTWIRVPSSVAQRARASVPKICSADDRRTTFLCLIIRLPSTPSFERCPVKTHNEYLTLQGWSWPESLQAYSVRTYWNSLLASQPILFFSRHSLACLSTEVSQRIMIRAVGELGEGWSILATVDKEWQNW